MFIDLHKYLLYDQICFSTPIKYGALLSLFATSSVRVVQWENFLSIFIFTGTLNAPICFEY